jgi:hypothetical protein
MITPEPTAFEAVYVPEEPGASGSFFMFIIIPTENACNEISNP